MGDVIVHNVGKTEFVGQFGGQKYIVPAGGKTAMSEPAARHLIGFGVKDPAELISTGARHGWHVKKDAEGKPVNVDTVSILKRFDDFKVVPARLAEVPKSEQQEEQEEEEEPTSLAPRSRRAAE